MTTKLVTENVWPFLTAAAKATNLPAMCAVAYFSEGASRLLPLRSGSQLVVDASEASVAGGRTCPKDLILLWQRGVRIFSVENLHSKLLVLGSRAYIGSANASSHSANTLLEAVLVTTDRKSVSAARAYVRSLCLNDLGLEELRRLSGFYRRPKIHGKRGSKRQKRSQRAALTELRITKLVTGAWPKGSESAQEAGEKIARSRRKHRATHQLDTFHWRVNSPLKRGQSVMQIIDEGDGQVFVSPPGNIIHTKKWWSAKRAGMYVYVELPKQRRKRLDIFCKQLGYGAKKRLSRSGRVADTAFAEKLRAVWQK